MATAGNEATTAGCKIEGGIMMVFGRVGLSTPVVAAGAGGSGANVAGRVSNTLHGKI